SRGVPTRRFYRATATRGASLRAGTCAGRAHSAAPPTSYAPAPQIITHQNPIVIDSTVASTALTTEKKPFVAHAQATYSSRWTVTVAIALSPSGMNAPRHRPSGASNAAVITT